MSDTAVVQSPLLERSLSTPLAWLSRDCCDSVQVMGGVGAGSSVSGAEFLAQARYLSEQLPHSRYFVNLVDNRYLFLLALCATWLRRSTCLLPQNRTPGLRAFFASNYEGAITLHDGKEATPGGVDLSLFPIFAHSRDVVRDSSGGKVDDGLPQIADEHVAVVCFTSGSTGDPKPVRKTWRVIRESSRINRRYFCADAGNTTVFHYAGVPQQHMWGLETTIFLPLFSNVCTVDAHAALPGDVMHQLQQLPRPLSFIGTPLHLKGLQTLQRTSPKTAALNRVLCATSPLDELLAAHIEEQFGTQVHEIYGCSEVGSMAHRRTAKTDLWTRFEGIHFAPDAVGTTIASAAHLDASFELGDRLTLTGSTEFRLLGRGDDLIKIAGKRGSLSEVNKTLLRYPGVVDGVVFLPESQGHTTRLSAIVCLSSDSNREGLMRHLRENLDSTFVPRPVYFVDALPRQATGKLPKQVLLDLHAQLKASR